MPEGDSIHRLARHVREALLDRHVTGFTAHTIPDDVASSVVGRRVVSVDARGKNLLVTFDDARVLHVHLKMLGRVRLERPRSAFWNPLREPPQLRLAVAGAAIVGSRIPVLRLLSATEARRIPDLAGLGPDLLAPDFDEAEAVRRLASMRSREIGDALLQQRALAGIGNVYKSEVLFVEKVHPQRMVGSLTNAEIGRLVGRARTLLAQNLGDAPRRTRSALGGPRLFVYRRQGSPCFRCRTPVVRILQGGTPGRSTYFCPTCQAP